MKTLKTTHRVGVLFVGILIVSPLCADESNSFTIHSETSASTKVTIEAQTTVRLREHPRTQKPYAAIVSADKPDGQYPFSENLPRYCRPDYRMLDRQVKSGQIPYDGPHSDRTKVYVFAAAMAATGALGAAALPAGSGVAAGSGALLPVLGAGSAVALGGAGWVIVESQPDPHAPFKHHSEARLIEMTQ